MGRSGSSDVLGRDLCSRVLRALGFARVPTPALSGLRSLYRAWCASIPFDNLRKMIALRSGGGGPLPGGHADEFFQSWLDHGAGGTCWPSSNALFALLRSLGFDARRLGASMREMGVTNHATVKVRIDGADWLVDSSMLTNEPLPLGASVFISPDRVFSVEVEREDGAHVVWTDFPPNSTYLPCRVSHAEMDHAQYLAGYEASRERGAFNQRLYARRNFDGELLVLLASTLVSKTAAGVERRELSRDELLAALRERIGISDQLIARWIESGALDATFDQSISSPKPPPITRKPPSLRAC